VLRPEQLELALSERERSSRRLGELLVEWGWVSSRAIAQALAEYGLEFLDLTTGELEQAAARLLPEEAARRLQALPVRLLPDGLLLVAVADPTDMLAVEELRSVLGRAMRLVVVDGLALEKTFARLYGRTRSLET
jgi:type IV pilus assembly protein PilB